MAELRKQEALAKQIRSHYSGILKSTKAKESSIHYLETRLDTLEKYWTDTYNNHWSIVSDPANDNCEYVANSLFSNIEEDYTATKAAILREIKKLKANNSESSSSMVPGNTVNTSPRGSSHGDNSWKHLPPLSLPKFLGNQLEWETFRDMFTAMVVKTKLSDVQKLYYLKTSLIGKAAERIKNLTVNESNYTEAWSMLVKRYDNKRILLATHMRKLLSCPAASKRSVDEILRLLDATNELIRAFKNMDRPVDLWDDWFVHLLVHKLDPCTREEWEKHLKVSEEFPNFDELASFLENTVRALEASHPFDKFSNTSLKNHTNMERKSIVSVNLSQTESSASPKSCPLCQNSHFISYCPQFKKLTIPQRWEKTKRLNLCSNCLRANHKLEDCPSNKRCFVCNGVHHTFLHDNPQTPLQQPVKSTVQLPATPPAEQVECHASYISNHLSDPQVSTTKGIFATAYVKLTSFKGRSIIVRSFLDSGSERTLITERISQILKLPKLKCDVSLGNSSLGSVNHKVDLWLQSPKDSSFQLPLQALVLRSLMHLVPKVNLTCDKWHHLQNLDLADPNYCLPGQIDCVIWIDLFGHILVPGLKQVPLNSPTGLRTALGWIIFGTATSQNPSSNITPSSTSILHVEERDSLSHQLRVFWEMEELPQTKLLSKEEIDCENIINEGHYRDKSGRYVVRLPLLKTPNLLGHSKEQVISMFKKNEVRLSKDPTAKAKYNTFMEDYLQLNHMRPLSQEDRLFPKPNYLPHHVVTKAHDPLSKIRVVFQSSFQTTSGASLNDILHPGQKLQLDIWLILTRWRFWKCVFAADIVKMFRQIRIDPPKHNLQRIVWTAEPSEPIQEFNLTTVTYGTRSAPFLTIRVLHQLALDEEEIIF